MWLSCSCTLSSAQMPPAPTLQVTELIALLYTTKLLQYEDIQGTYLPTAPVEHMQATALGTRVRLAGPVVAPPSKLDRQDR
jgi:hypothetical protein